MAMGKYGGKELNYASDIDVLFVSEDADGAQRVARDVIAAMHGLFRVDADLRPEGRDGPLVRTLDSYRAYYERWAEVWEFQALIKCRFAAGDESLGLAFMDMIQTFVWPAELAPGAIEQIRALKARAEHEVNRRGTGPRQVKLGPGGIRDVEFAVQLLQLVHGRDRPELRAPSTLDALEALASEGYVGEDDASDLAAAYVFLRHTEHRLQLESGRQTHTLPDAPARREYIARGLRFRDTPQLSALQSFEDRWQQTTKIVRGLHERLFYRPLLETFATASASAADDRLFALGYDRPPRVRDAIATMTSGAGRRAKVMRAILPGVLAWAAETPEPDEAVVRLAGVVSHLDSLPHLLAVLRDEPPVVELLCKALGTGPVLAGMLEREPTFIGALATDRPADLRSRAVAVVRRAATSAEAVSALRRFKDAEFLSIATHDLAAGEDPRVFVDGAARLSDLGDAALEAALDVARREVHADGSFAVVAMGRLGGHELAYASDLDVMFVYEGEARLQYAEIAERIMQSLGSVPPIFRVDAELRPEGRSGAIVRSLDFYLEYYERWAQLWEFQALIRARHAAGDPALTARLVESVSPRVWRGELSQDELNEIRHVKARIERERVGSRQDPRRQVKLGVGGLADVEFTVQLLQMRHGRDHEQLRTPNTLRAINALDEAKLIDSRDAGWLRDAYLLLNRVRDHMFLLRGLATDVLPTRDVEISRLASSLGYGRLSRSRFLDHYRRVTRRARQVTDRLFYGE
jgi:glutamate-ammonia-ligase adenylyltransferase